MSPETGSGNPAKNLSREPRLQASLTPKDRSLLTNPPIIPFRKPDAVELSHRTADIVEVGQKIVLVLGDRKGTNQINLSRKEKVLAEFFIENYLKGQPTYSLELKSHIEKAIEATGKKLHPLDFDAEVKGYEQQIKSKFKGKLKKAKWEIAPIERGPQGRLSYDLRRMENLPTKAPAKVKAPKPIVVFPKKSKDSAPLQDADSTDKDKMLNKLIEESRVVIVKNLVSFLSEGSLRMMKHDLNIFMTYCLTEAKKNPDQPEVEEFKKRKGLFINTIRGTLTEILAKEEESLSFREKITLKAWDRLEKKYGDDSVEKFVNEISAFFGIQLPETVKTNETTSSPEPGFPKD